MADAPFAAGVHLPWWDVPQHVMDWVDGVAGEEPREAHDLAGGFSPGAVARLVYDHRPDVFVKAVSADLNPDSPALHRREAVIAGILPMSPLLPWLMDTYDHQDWVVLVFDAIDGRLPRHPWTDDELTVALGGLSQIHDLLTPSPDPGVTPATEHFAPMFGGWRSLAEASELPSGLDAWSRTHLDQLAELETQWGAAARGSTLLHGDVRSDNMLITESGMALVDWPHASIGSPVLDLVIWAPSVTLEGGPPPEHLVSRHRPSRDADPDAVSSLIAAVAGFFTAHSHLPAPPGLPTLRAFQAAQGEVARAWLGQRMGWR